MKIIAIIILSLPFVLGYVVYSSTNKHDKIIVDSKSVSQFLEKVKVQENKKWVLVPVPGQFDEGIEIDAPFRWKRILESRLDNPDVFPFLKKDK